MSTTSQILRQYRANEAAIRKLRVRLSHSHSYTDRANLHHRIRVLQDKLRELYAQYLKATPKDLVTVFGTSKKPRVYAGLSSRMDLSTDGSFFSNPLKNPSHNQRVWVRLTVDIAQKSPFSTVKTALPEIARVQWVIPSRWTRLDVYPRAGRNEYFISMPLVITREFKAPSSGSTSSARFGAYVDPYYSIEPEGGGNPGGGAIVTSSNIVAHFEAGTYRFYSRAANVLDSAADTSISASDWNVADGDVNLYYTDGATFLNVRQLLSGPHSGKYVVTGQNGITLSDLTLEDLGA